MCIIIYKRFSKWMCRRMSLKLYRIVVKTTIKPCTDIRTSGDKRRINGSAEREER